MNADRFTVKTQEAVQAAVSLAAQHRNPQALPLHLLAALLDQEGSAAAGVLRRVGVDPQAVRADYRYVTGFQGSTVVQVPCPRFRP